MAEQIEHEERKLIAAAEVNEDLSGDSLIKQFQGIEVKANADEQLLALKRKMGLLPGGTQEQARALGKGREGCRAARGRRRGAEELNKPEAPSSDKLSSATFVALFVAALVVLFILKVIGVLRSSFSRSCSPSISRRSPTGWSAASGCGAGSG